MFHFRSLTAFFAALILLFSASFAEENGSSSFEADDIDWSFEELISQPDEDTPVPDDEPEAEVFTPSHGSKWDHDLGSSYWPRPWISPTRKQSGTC